MSSSILSPQTKLTEVMLTMFQTKKI